MKKKYISPEFDLTIFRFDETMSGAYLNDSRAEDGASGGEEGGGGEFGEEP